MWRVGSCRTDCTAQCSIADLICGTRLHAALPQRSWDVHMVLQRPARAGASLNRSVRVRAVLLSWAAQRSGRHRSGRRLLRDSCCAAGARPAKRMDYRRAGNIDPADFPKLKQDCVLFHHPSCKPLAEKIAASGNDISLGKIDWGCALRAPRRAARLAGPQLGCGHIVDLDALRAVALRTLPGPSALLCLTQAHRRESAACARVSAVRAGVRPVSHRHAPRLVQVLQ